MAVHEGTNMRIGFTCGAFDLLHAGHIVMLKEAKSECDYLIVGLQTDPSIDRQEKNQPIQTVYERYCLLYTSPSPRDRQKSRMPSSA